MCSGRTKRSTLYPKSRLIKEPLAGIVECSTKHVLGAAFTLAASPRESDFGPFPSNVCTDRLQITCLLQILAEPIEKGQDVQARLSLKASSVQTKLSQRPASPQPADKADTNAAEQNRARGGYGCRVDHIV